jgi:hypothetical protein
MKKQDLEKLIETIVRQKLTESTFIIGQYINKTYPLMQDSVDTLINVLQKSEGYEKNKMQYNIIITDINRLFNNFDAKLRKLIDPIKSDYI